MSESLRDIDERTRLAGANRLEMLLFQLGNKANGALAETFGINVFKIREIMRTPEITAAPGANPSVVGMISLRGDVVPVIDLAKYIGYNTENERNLVIITEYNGRKQAFLVWRVDTICRVEWSDVIAPPDLLSGQDGLVTSITKLPDGRLVSLLDVEKVLAEISGTDPEHQKLDVNQINLPNIGDKIILCCDDSTVARNQIKKTLDLLGLQHRMFANGAEIYRAIQSIASANPLSERVACIISDVEMPEMDGFTLTKLIKENDMMKDVPIIMHSSLSASENQRLGSSVGADFYVSKFEMKRLAEVIAIACKQ